jgi:16S rRNA (guanine527-N7)-methyltransferase
MKFREDVLKFLNINLSEYQLNQFKQYYEQMIEYNKHTNLTRIIDEHEVYYKHFYDSITLAKSIDINQIKSICDMGSGAGFPSIPLKIIYPHLEVTIIDSLQKRIKFLDLLIDNLRLDFVNLNHERIETYATGHQNQFDVVTARALGNLSLILEMGIPMVKLNGLLVAFKALNYQEEINSSEQALKTIGARLNQIESFNLPYDYGYRTHIIIKKEKHVEGYPRQFSLMTKKPL